MNLKRVEAISYLTWLLDAGADETISEVSQNRFKQSEKDKAGQPADFQNQVLAIKNKKSTNIDKTEKKILTKNQKIELAENLAKRCNSFDQISECVKSFPHFSRLGNNKDVELYDGCIGSSVVVFREPDTYNITTGKAWHNNLNNQLFEKIFDSIGLNVTNEVDTSLCVISVLPLVFEDYSESNDFNLDLMWPFLLRYVSVMKPVAVIFIGNNFFEKYGDIDLLISEENDLKDLQIFNFPSLDVLIRAPKRKRLVWEQLLSLKKILLKRKK
mgnify:CR=1 FL=1